MDLTTMTTNGQEQLALEKQPMNVLLCTDRAFVEPMCVTITSLLINNYGTPFALFIVLTDPHPDDCDFITHTVEPFSNARLNFIPFDHGTISSFPVHNHISVTAYVRLYLTEYLDPSIKRILYLDGDVIVRKEVMRLWETDLCGFPIAAAQDPWVDHLKTIGFSDENPYYNTGILLVDVERWRSLGLTKVFDEFIRSRSIPLKYLDQDVINVVLKGNIKKLDYEWNFASRFADLAPTVLGMNSQRFERVRKDPAIVHFTTASKPWIPGREPHYKSEFQKYHRMLSPRISQARSTAVQRHPFSVARLNSALKWYLPKFSRAVRRWTRTGDPVLRLS